MHNFQLLLLLLATALAASAPFKLSTEQNRQRAAQCGQKLKNKLYNGKLIAGSEAPWIVAVGFGEKKHTLYQTGFIISDRHVITNMDAIFWDRGARVRARETFRWRLTGNYANLEGWKANGTFGIADTVRRRMGVYQCADKKAGENCVPNDSGVIRVTRGMYLGNTDTKQISFGLVLLELEKPINKGGFMCIPDKEISTIGETLRAYSLGRQQARTLGDPFTAKLNTAEVKVTPCTDPERHPSLSVCTSSVVCDLDNGAPVTKTVDGKVFAVASLTSWGCLKDEKQEASDNHVSIGKFSTVICELTGICPV